MANRFDVLVSLFSILSDEKASQGRDQDLRRASFTLHDVADVRLENNVLSVFLQDGRSWKGRPDELRWSEIQELGKWAEIMAVEASLGVDLKKNERRKSHQR